MDCKWEGVKETILYLIHITIQNNKKIENELPIIKLKFLFSFLIKLKFNYQIY